MNLLQETLNALQENGKTPEDITFIGDEDGYFGCTWEQFTEIANVDYTFVSDAESNFQEGTEGIVAFGCSRLPDDFPNMSDKDVDDNDDDVSDMVAGDLCIRFSDYSVMYRREFDGMTGWNFQPAFKPKDNVKEIKSLVGTAKFPFSPTVGSLDRERVKKSSAHAFFVPGGDSVN